MKGANRCWLESRAVILGDPFRITVKGGWLALNEKFVNPQLQAISPLSVDSTSQSD